MTDPVTLFAARGLVNLGTGPVTHTFDYVASTFSDVRGFEWEPLATAVSADLAYTAAIERYTNSRDGGPPEPTELRATHVYRREDGQWRAVHRHAARRPADPEELTRRVEAFREALRSYVKGDPEPALGFFSERDDVTLVNPLEPPRRGPAAVAHAARKAGAVFQEGGPMRFVDVVSAFEEIARVTTADLAYVLQIERHEGRIAGNDDNVISALHTTTVFRREGDTWRISHRHADPILSERGAQTLFQD